MVSVVIPVYNRANTITRSINSVLNQTYHDIEIIVVDDGSTDNTYEVVSQIKSKDNRVEIIRSDNNGGACAARNIGVERAKGEYIAFQDSDDVWDEEKLEKQINAMEQWECDICFCQFLFEKKRGKCVRPLDYKPGVQKKFNTVFKIGTQTLVFKRNVIKHNLFDEEMPRLQDFELLMRIVNDHRVFFLKEALVKREMSDNSITKQNDNLLRACELLYKKHPDLRIKFPKANRQIALSLVRDSFGADKALQDNMLRKAIEIDKVAVVLLWIPYRLLYRMYR